MLKTSSWRKVIPNDAKLRREIFYESHQTWYTIHPENNKMCQDLKKKFWWCDMKRNVAKYTKCPSCQLEKAEHQRSVGKHQPLKVPMWKWNQIAMDFVVGLPKAPRRQDAIRVIVDRLTKSAHFLPIKITDSLDKLA
jgi:hypothetical protein